MRCPFCHNSDSRVLESRPAADSPNVRRRRECISCKKRWTTQERFEVIDLTVLKRNHHREPFDRFKILRGLTLACQKTGVTRAQIERLVDEIETELHERARGEVSVQFIGELVLAHLKQLNEVAYIRYASVYHRFRNADDFIADLIGKPRDQP
ncbi:transcriptional regulator NrdR [Anthocerotibacter panamensis]|uniref:transcriptional regulator NrdR n=1 Tax=Anthocerotibacter panamensis TaxID=2857077 RepID=UPI001C405C96|nr:transcriptional regulator NrdR [Anthocerotibacter panamensis]